MLQLQLCKHSQFKFCPIFNVLEVFGNFLKRDYSQKQHNLLFSFNIPSRPCQNSKLLAQKHKRTVFMKEAFWQKVFWGLFTHSGGTAMAGHKVTQSKNVDTKRGVATKSIHRRLTACGQQEIMKGGQVLLYKLILSEMRKWKWKVNNEKRCCFIILSEWKGKVLKESSCQEMLTISQKCQVIDSWDRRVDASWENLDNRCRPGFKLQVCFDFSPIVSNPVQAFSDRRNQWKNNSAISHPINFLLKERSCALTWQSWNNIKSVSWSVFPS